MDRLAEMDEIEELFDDITRDIVKTEQGISAANLMHYETNVIERGPSEPKHPNAALGCANP